MTHSYRTYILILLSCITLIIAACSTTPEQPKASAPIVFPPAPDQPRFIYERTLIYSSDVEQLSSLERFKSFATGTSLKVKGLVKPYGVSVHQGRVFVTDTVQRTVFVFDIPEGRFFTIGTESPGELIKPIGIDTSESGEVFVCDISARHIRVYDRDGRYLRTIGNSQLLQRPVSVAVANNLTYVVDNGGITSRNHQIVIFDTTTGEHIKTISKRGSDQGELNLPLQAATAPDGSIYVVDGGNFRVQQFDSNGNVLQSFGSVGRMPGQFARPKGIATDAAGNIYVVDTAFGNFQIFNSQGELLMFIGERSQAGSPGKYMLPADIDVDEDGRIYIVDQFFRKVDVFGPATLDKNQGYATFSVDPK